jgi:putative DNA primase/helicase
MTQAIIGNDNVVVTTMRELEDRFEGNRIFGKKLLLITDAAAYNGDVSTLKAITGGDYIRYERKGKDTARTQFKPSCMCMILTNHGGLQSSDTSSGLARRLINAVFNFQTGEIRDLDAEFEPYISGLLNWVIGMPQEEADSILRDHARQSQILADAQRDQFIQQYPICAWLDSNIVANKDSVTQVGNAKQVTEKNGDTSETVYKNSDSWLYPNYVTYCEVNGLKPTSSVKFTKLLVEACSAKSMLDLDFVKRTKIDGKASGIIGLKIRTHDDDGRSPLDYKFSPKSTKPVGSASTPVVNPLDKTTKPVNSGSFKTKVNENISEETPHPENFLGGGYFRGVFTEKRASFKNARLPGIGF